MVKILWVDDESKDVIGNYTAKGDSFISDAGWEGINVTAFNQYNDALHELELHPTLYTAIVLDVEDDRASDGDKKDGFMEAMRSIDSFHGKHNQKEPYVFVFTGHDKYTSGDSKVMTKPDYASKNVYLKGSDREILFEDIKKVAENSRLYQVFRKYDDVLKAAQHRFDTENLDNLREVIFRIEYEGKSTDDSILNIMRKILFYCFDHVPFDYPQLDGQGNRIENYAAKSKFIGDRRNSEVIAPYIQRYFHSLVEVLNVGSHSGDEVSSGNDEKNLKKKPVSVDVKEGKAPYLLRACMYELFNIIIWLDQDKFSLTIN